MVISQLISMLEAIKADSGDLPVTIYTEDTGFLDKLQVNTWAERSSEMTKILGSSPEMVVIEKIT